MPRFLVCLCVLVIALVPSRALSEGHDDEGSPPIVLSIPVLGVQAFVEVVGLEADGAVGAPGSSRSVAWYAGGALPGAPGNAILTGHVSWSGRPAVFARLRQLVAGDEVAVGMSDGSELRFIVQAVESFAFDDPEPMERIYGLNWSPRLNLVTCDGAWDTRTQNYSHRLVVFTTLAPPDVEETTDAP